MINIIYPENLKIIYTNILKFSVKSNIFVLYLNLMNDQEIKAHFNNMSDSMRNKFDLFICEEAIKLFEKNKKFKSFINWADKIRLEIYSSINSGVNKGWISNETTQVQTDLIIFLTDMFGFNDDEAYYLITSFFLEKSYVDFEAVAKANEAIFYKSIDKIFNKTRLSE